MLPLLLKPQIDTATAHLDHLLPEIATLESQLANLRATADAAKNKVNQLTRSEEVAQQALKLLLGDATKVATPAHDVIHKLIAVVRELYSSDGDNGGSQPVIPDGPAPQPEPPDGTNQVEQHDVGHPVVCRGQFVASADMEVSDAIPADGTEHLEGQSTELACQITDAPLMGQFTEFACSIPQNVVAIFEDKAIGQPPKIVEVGV